MIGALVALVLANLLLVFVPFLARGTASNYFWGMNVWRFLPATFAYAAAAAGALAALAGGGAGLRGPRAEEPGEPGRGDWPVRGRGWLVALAVACGAPAWLYHARERIHFLGDTYVRLRSAVYIASGFPMPADYQTIHAAPLDKLVLVALPGFAGRVHGWDELVVAKLVPCLLGGLFVLACWWLACELSPRPHVRAVVATFLVGQGYLQLFAGYLEAYGQQILVLTLWLAALVREWRRGTPAAWSSVFFGLGVMAHRVDLLVMPAQLAWFWLSRPRAAGAPGRSGWIAGFAAAFLAVLYTGLEWLPSFGEDLGFLTGHAQNGYQVGDYGLFSATHAANIASDLFLLAPGGLVVFLCLLAARGARWNYAPMRYVVAAGLPFLLLIMAVRSIYRGLGAVRDWDAYAPVGLFFAFAAALLLSCALDRWPRLRAAGWGVTLASLLFSVGWISVNADYGRALARAETVMRSNPPIPHYPRALAWETLAQAYLERDDYRKAAGAYLGAVDIAPNPRYMWLAGIQEWKAGERETAVRLFRMGAARDSSFRALMEKSVQGDLHDDPADSLSQAMLKIIRAVDDSVAHAHPGAPGR